MVTYHVYLNKTTAGPEDGTELTDWIYFICDGLDDIITVKDLPKSLAGHTSYKITLGQIVQGQALKNCVIRKTEVASGSNSQYYNSVKKFLLEHLVTGTGKGYLLYLYVYSPSGDGKYLEWMDNDEAMQDYCRVAVTGFRFKLDHSGVYRGNITLQECWI